MGDRPAALGNTVDDLGSLGGGPRIRRGREVVEGGGGIDRPPKGRRDDPFQSRFHRRGHGRVTFVVPRIGAPQLIAEAFDRVALLPLLQLFGRHVTGGVVGVGVRAHPVGDQLEQGGTVAGGGPLPCHTRGFDHREHVVAVDAHPGYPRRAGLGGERDRRGLALGGRGDGPTVVDARDDQRRADNTREVDPLVEVAFRCGAVADEGAHHSRITLQREPPCQPDRVRDLGAERDLRGHAAHAVGDATAVGMTAPVGDDLLEELVAQRAHADQVAVVGNEPVAREVERPHDADDRSFLPGEGGHGGETPLTLEVPEALRRPSGEEHVLHQDLMHGFAVHQRRQPTDR